MTNTHSADELRHWLVDYLVTNIGCSPDDIELDASFADLGVGSRDAVVLSGELAELAGRAISPVEMWQYPTINDLVEYLTNPEAQNRGAAAPEAAVVGGDEPIAVVGMGCRLPGGVDGPEALWRLLGEGRSAVGEVPAGRWGWFDDGSPESAAALAGTTRFGGFLDDIEGFDAEFFEISPREAAAMDPQQRLLLEVAHEALEHAGIRADALRRSQTGVFAGACAGEYGYLASSDLSRVDAWSGTGGALSIIANRLSYFLDLRGPSVTVDTACSSSLVAVHLACQSLRSGESAVALAAGVNLLLSPAITRSFDAAEALSASGQCHAFDAAADGFVRGEGCGVVVLKRLGDALRDGDRVWALVRGSAVNSDGRSNGLMAPNPAAQMAVLRAAYANAGVQAREVDYVEANATGTLLGDPIEARALGTVLGRGRRPEEPLLLGSVKPVLGHLDAAAGVVGLVKAVLALQRGWIPANLGFAEPNPHIPFEQLGLRVVGEALEWPVTGRPRRAGVSSFGFGGTNAHVVLEQGPEPVVVPEAAEPVVSTLVVSGKSAQRVAATAGVLAEWMDGAGAGVGLAQVAHGLNHHRARYPVFATVVARDRREAVAGLAALAAGRSAPGVVGPHAGSCRAGTVFVYSGQGSQWPGMGRKLLADEPAFAGAVAELEPVFVEVTGFSLREVLAGGESVAGIERIQPVLVGVQLALTALWRSYGIEPDAVIGHSMGEVTAAVVAGALSPRDGLRVITTLSGAAADPGGPDVPAALADLTPRRAVIPVVTADGAAPAFDAEHWASDRPNLVQVTDAVAAAGAEHGTFVEVSPHPLLTDAIGDTLAGVHHHSLGTLARDTHDTLTFHTNLNAAHTAKAPDTEHPAGPPPLLPSTPWHHTRHWVSAPRTVAREAKAAPHWTAIRDRLEAAVAPPRPGTLLGEHITVATTPPVHLWQARLAPDGAAPTVSESVLLQTLVTAATECGASAVRDVRFEDPVVVDEPQVIHVTADGESVTVSSDSAVHAGARLVHDPDAETGPAAEQPPVDVDLPEASTVALLDAALGVARGGARPVRAVGAESARLVGELAEPRGSVRVRRHGGGAAGDLVVDLVATAPGGGVCIDIRALRYTAAEPAAGQEATAPAWAELSADEVAAELGSRLRSILARELGMSASAVDVERPFPELGLDSMMAMAVLKDAKRLVGFDVSATKMWDHPTIAAMTEYLTKLIVAQHGSRRDTTERDNGADTDGSAGGVLDALFESVESGM
ncbi:beta-ketoacyl synthase N-terminal-like domain-containing protein [Mycobacterium servetii]|uniref:type I polyketide synthase n=1 Tax=Mycobacterium servetii TaxID=3237418 RepID=UPI00350F683D